MPNCRAYLYGVILPTWTGGTGWRRENVCGDANGDEIMGMEKNPREWGGVEIKSWVGMGAFILPSQSLV